MLDAKAIRAVIVAAQADFETSGAFISDEDVRGAVALELVKASGLGDIDLARLDLDLASVADVEAWQYFQLVALCYQGGAYTRSFKEAVATKKVVLVGGGMPPGWHESLEDFITSVDPDEAIAMVGTGVQFIVGTDVDGDETDDLAEAGVVGMLPLDATVGLVSESSPTVQQLAGMCLAFGGVFNGPTVVVKRGFKEVAVKLGKGEVVIDGKALASRVYLGNEISGDPELGLPALKAAYWTLLYAFAGTKGDQVTGRLAYTTAIFAEDDKTAVVEGRAACKYAGTMGTLTLGVDVQSGVVSVKNGTGETRVAGLAKALASGIAAFPQHQAGSIHVGEGASGMGVGLNGDTVLTLAQADKAEKIANRVSSSAKKACNEVGGLVESAFKVVVHN